MGESLWADFDAKVVGVVTEHLGPESDHAELRLNKIVATVLLDLSEFNFWAADDALPALVFEADRKGLGANSHGSPVLDKEYPCNFTVIAEGDEAECVRAVKVILDRLETVLMQQQPTLAISASNGERVQRLTLGNSMVVRVAKTSSEGTWYGIGVMELIVKTARTWA